MTYRNNDAIPFFEETPARYFDGLIADHGLTPPPAAITQFVSRISHHLNKKP